MSKIQTQKLSEKLRQCKRKLKTLVKTFLFVGLFPKQYILFNTNWFNGQSSGLILFNGQPIYPLFPITGKTNHIT